MHAWKPPPGRASSAIDAARRSRRSATSACATCATRTSRSCARPGARSPARDTSSRPAGRGAISRAISTTPRCTGSTIRWLSSATMPATNRPPSPAICRSVTAPLSSRTVGASLPSSRSSCPAISERSGADSSARSASYTTSRSWCAESRYPSTFLVSSRWISRNRSHSSMLNGRPPVRLIRSEVCKSDLAIRNWGNVLSPEPPGWSSRAATSMPRRARYSSSPTRTVSRETSSPRPRTRMPPLPVNRSAATWSSQSSVASSRMRRATTEKSGASDTAPASRGARRASATTLAARIIILLGTHAQ